MSTFVIIGASLAGAKAAETLRTEGFGGRIVLVGEETEQPYERPPLSKEYLQGTAERAKALVHEPGWYSSHAIDLRLGVRATMLDPSAHTVTLDGYETLRYDKLLLATGARPRRLDIPGAALSGVRYLRTLSDSDVLRERFGGAGARDDGPGNGAPRDGGPRNIVVIGAGWIGLETAAAARAAGANVTVIEMDSLPLRRVLGDELAHVYADLHRAHGVDLRFGTGVSAFAGEGGATSGAVRSVVLSDGTQIPADTVVVGVGAVPNVELASSAGLRTGNGIETNAYLQTSDPDIYACGDVAMWESTLVGVPIRVEHWGNALKGGPAAAKAMLGREAPYDWVPYFYSDQYDLGMEYAGYVGHGGYDRVVFRGDPSIVDGKAPEFIAFWVTSDGRVLAGMNANVWDVQDDIQNLVRAGYAGKSVDLVKLADPGVPLAELAG